MANLSVTNREQSLILAKAGLDLDTADYTIIVKLKKVDGATVIEETPYPHDTITYYQGLADKNDYTMAWSLGKLINLLPSNITSQYDINEKEQPDEGGVEYHLWMDKNYVMYSSDDGRQRFLTTGVNLIDSVVEMVRQLLAEDFELDYEKV